MTPDRCTKRLTYKPTKSRKKNQPVGAYPRHGGGMPTITEVTATKTNKPTVGMANPSPASLLSSSFLRWPMQETRTSNEYLETARIQRPLHSTEQSRAVGAGMTPRYFWAYARKASSRLMICKCSDKSAMLASPVGGPHLVVRTTTIKTSNVRTAMEDTNASSRNFEPIKPLSRCSMFGIFAPALCNKIALPFCRKCHRV